MKNLLLITFTLLAFVLKAQIVVTKSGTVPAASASDVNAGTSTSEAITPAGLAGSGYTTKQHTDSTYLKLSGNTSSNPITGNVYLNTGEQINIGNNYWYGDGASSYFVSPNNIWITNPSQTSYININSGSELNMAANTISISGALQEPLQYGVDYSGSYNSRSLIDKGYLLSQLGSYVPFSGGTFTGALILAADPTTALGAATKQYVDAQTGNYVPLRGNFNSINIQSGSGSIINNIIADSTQFYANTITSTLQGQLVVNTSNCYLAWDNTSSNAGGNVSISNGGSAIDYSDQYGNHSYLYNAGASMQLVAPDSISITSAVVDVIGTQINHGDIHLTSNNNIYFGNSNTYARYDAGLKGLSLYSYDATSTNGNNLALEPGGVVLSAQHGYPFPSASSTLDLTSTKLTVNADTTNIIGLLLNNGSPISGGSSFTGGTLTSPLILAGDPTTALGAATKQYVDNNYVPFSFTGNEAISSTGNLGVVAGGAMSFTSSGNLNLNPGGTAKVNGNNILTTTNIDAIPTSGSTNVAGSGGVYNQLVSVSNALAGKPGLTTNNTLTGTNTFTGEVIVPTPVNSTDATTKTYVDAQCGNYVPLNGTVSNINISSGSYLRTDYEQIVMDSTQFKVAGYGQVDLSSYTEGGGYPYADLNLLDGNIVLQSVGSSKSSIVSLYTDSISLAADTIDINGVLLNNGSAVQTQNNNSIVLIGDSYIAFHLGGSAPSVTVAAMGYFNWANMLLGKRFHVLQYAGIGGQTTTQILARFKTDALALNPGWILFDGGINDINAGASATTIFNNLKAMIQASQGIGAKVILTTIPIIRAWSSSQANRNVAHSVNAMLKQYCRGLNNVILIDWNPLLLSTTDGMVSSNYTFDNTHMNLLGNAIVGDYMANILQGSLPYYDALPWSLDDEYTTNTDYAHTNLVLNGMLTGTTGYPSSTNVATNWKISSSFLSGGGTPAYNTDYISSKVNALRPSIPDYRSFDFQQIQILPSNGIEKDITFWPSTTTIGSQFSVGDWVYAGCEFEVDADWNAVSRFQLRLSQGGGGTNADSDDLFGYAANGNGNFPGATSPVYIPRKGTFRTYPFQLTTGNTYLYPAIDFYGIAGTVRIGRMAIRKATPVTVGTKTVFYY